MISPSSITALISALRTDDRRAHTLVVEDLVKIGPTAVEPLLAVLHDPNPNVRQGATRALGKIGDRRALGALIVCLRSDPDIEVRKSAVWALHMGDNRAVPALVEALSDPDEWVRFGAMIVLAKIGEPAVKSLTGVLQHPDPVVRGAAAETLGRIGDRRAIDALVLMLSDSTEDVRYQAALALGRMGDARAIDQLMRILRNPRSDLRTKAIKALGQIGDVRAVDPLIEIVYDEEDRWLRLFAIEALGVIGDFRAVEVLLDMAYDENHDLRTKAIVSLGELPFAFALDALYSLAQDDEHYREDRQNALLELGKRGDLRAQNGLIDLLREDPYPDTRMLAALALAELKQEGVVQPLLTAVCKDVPEVAEQAMKALVKLSDIAVKPLFDTAVRSRDVDQRQGAVRALGEIGTESAIAVLSNPVFAQTDLYPEVVAILKRLGQGG